MGEIRMYSEARTDYDCEVTGLPAERWGEAVFKIGDQEVVFEVSVEKDVIVAIMINDNTTWKGTLKGLTQLIQDANKNK